MRRLLVVTGVALLIVVLSASGLLGRVLARPAVPVDANIPNEQSLRPWRHAI